MNLLLKFLLGAFLTVSAYWAASNVSHSIKATALPEQKYVLVSNNTTPVFYIDQNADPLIFWAVQELQQDIKEMTGQIITLQVVPDAQRHKFSPYAIYVAQVGSKLYEHAEIPAVIKRAELKGKWEHFFIQKEKQALFVVGSDVRGTVFAIFEVAERLGISPWKWWADVHNKIQRQLVLTLPAIGLQQSPAVQYRGVFLNDEDWGLQPWAAKTFETKTGDIGPKTYEKIFQLLLRLKANTIWPAMHPSTKAFYSIDGNQQMAQKYHIVVGTSHAEPMLRNNVGEWDKRHYGDYNYVSNSKAINHYWQQRIQQVKAPNNHNMFTIGMRGVHDSKMQGINNAEQAIHMLEKIISNQRNMLSSTLKLEPTQIPQAFIPYKEVLNLYNRGLSVPNDVTIIWPDDNYGYIRRLSNKQEQERIGGSGVYYHISYWGRPHDYLWLSTHQPGLIWYEMSKAYANGATKAWIVNVGDIKPAEYNMELFLDLAWEINAANTDVNGHLRLWLSREFNTQVAHELANIMSEFYRLAFLRKPEFMGWSQTEPTTQTALTEFSDEQAMARIMAYKALSEQVTKIAPKISSQRKDAFYQLIEYPVKSATAMNAKYLHRQLAVQCETLECKQQHQRLSLNAHQHIQDLTQYYNTRLSNGKWQHMMSSKPRKLPVFQAPSFDFSPSKALKQGNHDDLQYIKANAYSDSFSTNKATFSPILGLGHSNAAVTLFPLKQQQFDSQKPWLEYNIKVVNSGQYTVDIRTLPTHANKFDHRIELFLNNEKLGSANLNSVGRSEEFKQNVLRNSQIKTFKVNLLKAGEHTLRITFNQTGIVLDQIAIYPSGTGTPYAL